MTNEAHPSGTAQLCGVQACARCEAARIQADLTNNEHKAEKALERSMRAASSLPDINRPFYRYDPTFPA